jgi:hypothetical protein
LAGISKPKVSINEGDIILEIRGVCGSGGPELVYKTNRVALVSLVLTAALPTVTSLNQQKCVRAYV